MGTIQGVEPGLRAPGRERLRTLAVMVVVAIAIAGAVFLLDKSGAASYTTIELTGDLSGGRPLVGGKAPDFSATTVDGKTVSLAGLAGRPVWLSFGASWCADCRAEAPDLEATWKRYAPQGLAVVTIWLQESDQEVRDYASRLGLDFTMIADPSTALASRYRTYGLPTHFFINPDGTIREIRLGGLPPDEMDRLVRSILN